MVENKPTTAPLAVPERLDLTSLPAIAFGAGVFSGVYNDDAPDPPVLVRRAFELGVRHFDTSPYYGDSERLLGGALAALRASTPSATRESLFIVTKAGRYGEWDFDYSASRIRASVAESLRRLQVDHLDACLLHDVEFVSSAEVVEAAAALFELKDAGVVRSVGLSCYPLQIMVDRCSDVLARLGRPLDVVMSYSNHNIQNTLLAGAVGRLTASPEAAGCGVKAVWTASPLSMGLFRPQGPPSWHPASDLLKQRTRLAGEKLASLSRDAVCELARRRRAQQKQPAERTDTAAAASASTRRHRDLVRAKCGEADAPPTPPMSAATSDAATSSDGDDDDRVLAASIDDVLSSAAETATDPAVAAVAGRDASQRDGRLTLPDVALGFALRNAHHDGLATTVLGFGYLHELEHAVDLYHAVEGLGSGGAGAAEPTTAAACGVSQNTPAADGREREPAVDREYRLAAESLVWHVLGGTDSDRDSDCVGCSATDGDGAGVGTGAKTSVIDEVWQQPPPMPIDHADHTDEHRRYRLDREAAVARHRAHES